MGWLSEPISAESGIRQVPNLANDLHSRPKAARSSILCANAIICLLYITLNYSTFSVYFQIMLVFFFLQMSTAPY